MRRVTPLLLAGSVALASIGAGSAVAAGGDPDVPGFGLTDAFHTKSYTGDSSANDVVLQGTRIIAAGISGNAGSERATIRPVASNGNPDPSFSGFEFVGQYNFEDAVINGVAVQADRELVTGGISGSPLNFAVMARHAADGGGDPDVIELAGSATSAQINDVAIGSGEKPVGVGSATFPGGQDFFIMGLTSGFNRDTGFGPAGVPEGEVFTNVSNVLGNSGGADSAEAVAVDPADGDVIVAGSVDPDVAAGGDTSNVAVLRYTSAGSLDTASGYGGGTGVVNIDIQGGGSDVAADVTVQPDGKILVAGTRFAGGAFDHFLMRLNANGTPDSTFGDGADGKFVQTAVTPNNSGTGLALTPEGKVYLGGTSFVADTDWVLARYTASGLPDTAFDGDGSRTYSFTGENGVLNQIALQTDGKVVGAGAIGGDLAVGRFKADDPPVVIDDPPAVNPSPNPAPTPKKCKKSQKLKKGKCVKKKRRKRR
jgi:uncharacterized delta-60 repeat protein